MEYVAASLDGIGQGSARLRRHHAPRPAGKSTWEPTAEGHFSAVESRGP
jgi:hypothetical protein